MHISPYTPDQKTVWDAFVAHSINGTFLFYRDYMDYHAARFADHSLLFWDEKGRLLAVLPAHLAEGRLVSHGGLSYGGLVIDADAKTPLVLAAFAALLDYCQARGFTGLTYKPVPPVYHLAPANADLYALFDAGATLQHRTLLSVIDTRHRPATTKGRRWAVKKAARAGLRVCHSDDLPAYWLLLQATLQQNHQAKPVHTLAEIQQLAARFPQNIKLYACYAPDETLLAGVLMYESAQVARTQYIAASDAGRQHAALDLLFDHLLGEVYAHIPYFEFGTSHYPGTHQQNLGLLEYKESFGARAVAQDTYQIEL